MHPFNRYSRSSRSCLFSAIGQNQNLRFPSRYWKHQNICFLHCTVKNCFLLENKQTNNPPNQTKQHIACFIKNIEHQKESYTKLQQSTVRLCYQKSFAYFSRMFLQRVIWHIQVSLFIATRNNLRVLKNGSLIFHADVKNIAIKESKNKILKAFFFH